MELPFVPLVRKHFAFLEREFGYRRIDEHSRCVRWESEEVLVEIGYDHGRSYELGAQIGRLGETVDGHQIAYDLSEIARWRGLAYGARAITAVTDDELDARLGDMAQALQAIGTNLLLNDERAYAGLAQFRQQECAAHARDQELSAMREDATAAWKAEAYSIVVMLYEEHLDELTPAEKKRLEIARERAREEELP